MSENIIGDPRELNRVRWAAKRGMLELDLILEPYVEHVYMSLSSEEKADFLALLEAEDQDLFCWFIQSKPADQQHKQMVTKVLDFKRTFQAEKASVL